MIKKEISVYSVVDTLNELLKLDPLTINALFRLRVHCGEDLANHPSVQVLATKRAGNEDANVYSVGLIGIINGFFGSNKDAIGCIAMCLDDKTHDITNFVVLEDRLKKENNNE